MKNAMSGCLLLGVFVVLSGIVGCSDTGDALDETPVEDSAPEQDVADNDASECASNADCVTETDSCFEGQCNDGLCEQVVLSDLACDDGDLCTSNDTCDEKGQCLGGEDLVVESGLCETCACDPVEGVTCFASAIGAPCSDDDCCTEQDQCELCDPEVDENCQTWGMGCVAGAPKDCNDGNECTVNQCKCDSENQAQCVDSLSADNLPCDFSENDCTLGDHCVQGICVVGTPADLDDENPCTVDSCLKGDVTHEPALSGQCDDGNECTTGDSCYLGTCVGGDAVTCVIPDCASDAVCVQGAGCTVAEESWMPMGASCDDGNTCTTQDQCQADHTCSGEENPCEDFNPCTLDTCSGDGGCVNEADPSLEGTACGEDGNACVSAGVCQAGTCAQEPLNTICDDENPCTIDDCDPLAGCVFTAGGDGSGCDDGDPCTTDDVCSQGACIGTDSESGGDTVTCSQVNAIDTEGTCCCFAEDPTGDHKSGHVLDMALQPAGTEVECCLAPGLNVGCQDTAFFDVSTNGASWAEMEAVSTTSSKDGGVGAWVPTCVTFSPGEEFQYIRGANDTCYVDHFSCTLTCGNGEQCTPQDGGWTEPVFGPCSAECGGGQKTGSRTCTNPTPSCGGAQCSGEATVVENCNPEACPESLSLGDNIFDDGGTQVAHPIPPGASMMTVRAWGAGGGGGYPGVGGGGAFVKSKFAVNPGEELIIMVASGGAKFGGGGGASMVALKNQDIVVAAGGGGAGSDGNSGNSTPALASSGGGGGAVGGTGQSGGGYENYGIAVTGGSGATENVGGNGGQITDYSVYDECVSAGQAGTFYKGGQGASGPSCGLVAGADQWNGGSGAANGGSGGGGAGYYGGGSGSQKYTFVGSGGGGGSSWVFSTALTTDSEAASVNSPGGGSDEGYSGQAGVGGGLGLGSTQPTAGHAGRIIITLD